MLFVIFVFTKHHVESVIGFLERNIPFLKNGLTQLVAKQKEMLHSPHKLDQVHIFYPKIYNLIS